MIDYDFWEEQEKAEREYDSQQEEIADAYGRGYEKGKADAIEEFIEKFEEVDSCEFAMFSLCLIKEIAEQLKEQKNN